jgi:DNA-binding MarR family transcriptional regulator
MARRQQRSDDHIEEVFAAWRRERPGLDLSGMALVARLMRVAHRFDEAQSEFFTALGLKPGWLDVLGALRRAGDPYRLTPTRLSEEALISTAGMTNRLDRLEAAGLIVRLPDPDDRRGVLVELTPEGLELVDSAIDAHRGLSRRLLGSLESRERDDLDALLKKLLQPLDSGEAPAPASLFPTGRVAPRRRRR